MAQHVEDKLTNSARGESAPVSVPTLRRQPLDPPPELAELRERHPLCRVQDSDGDISWLVTGHAQARAVLADRRFGRAAPLRPPLRDVISSLATGMFMLMDPPQHTRLRRNVAGYFTVRRINEHRTRIERIVADRLDVMDQAGPPVDLVEEFALPVSGLAACELLGIPPTDRNEFEMPVETLMDPASTPDQLAHVFGEFVDYAKRVVRHKRAHPGDDVLSELVGRGDLNDDESAGLVMQLFLGHETAASTITLATFALLRDRDRWEALRATPTLIDTAVEEFLRYLSTAEGVFPRTALEDVELGGTLIKAGEIVNVSLSAANRDPDRFPEPDELDLTEGDAAGHVAFGHGVHQCLGQHLGRLELRLGLAGLVQRFPGLRLAVDPGDLFLESTNVGVYRARELPVTW